MMLGYFQTVERTTPARGLELAVQAERLGFDMVTTADHFHPFWHTGANTSFAWAWIAAVLSKTTSVSASTAVTPPVLRYHPAIVAQAWATMASIFPGRLFLALGSGEAVNEIPLGYELPVPRERIERLEEVVSIIKLLLDNETPSRYFSLNRAYLYTKPDKPPHVLSQQKVQR